MENRKDVFINVTGVSITGTGELRTDEPNRPIEADNEETEGEETTDSE
jgi:hypothetical protein|tara:strand:- start:1859 stop:2002 length:144 start_codon:yes stop_codon:yes gene_type:complete